MTPTIITHPSAQSPTGRDGTAFSAGSRHEALVRLVKLLARQAAADHAAGDPVWDRPGSRSHIDPSSRPGGTPPRTPRVGAATAGGRKSTRRS